MKVYIAKKYMWDDRKFRVGSGSCARVHYIKHSIYSDGRVGFCEYKHKLLTLRTAGAKALHVAPQSGSVAYYAVGVSGKKPPLPSLLCPLSSTVSTSY